MKYSQFIELNKLLKDNDITLQEWLDNPEIELKNIERLNEILGIKSLISWGIMKPIHLSKIKSVAQDFMKESMKGLTDALQPYLDSKQKILDKEETSDWKGLSKESRQQILTIEKKIENVLTSYVSKVRQMKTDAVYKRIEKAKGLTEAAKLSLKYTWETLATKVETSLLSKLLENKVLMAPVVIQSTQEGIKGKYIKIKDIEGTLKNTAKIKQSIDTTEPKKENEEKIKKIYSDIKSIKDENVQNELEELFNDKYKKKTKEEEAEETEGVHHTGEI